VYRDPVATTFYENTVKLRIKRTTEILGRPADERIAEILVALRFARLLDIEPEPPTR
jgi:hypothetical protein